MTPRRLLLPIIALALALFTPSTGRAWTEARPAGLVTELNVDRDGGAIVTLRVRWRVLAGRLHQFDLAELPQDFTLLEASATTASGAPVPLTARSNAPGRLEVDLGESQGGVRRGAVDVVLRYSTSLRAQGAIQRANNDAVLELATVPWERGLEAVEVRVAMPPGARKAQWIFDDTPGVDATTTSELSRDVVHAVRRHVPAGTRWVARVAADPNLFPWLSSGAHRGPRLVVRERPPYRTAGALAAGLLAALGLAVALVQRRYGAPRWLAAPRTRWIAPTSLVAGVALQSLTLLDVSGALTAGTALLLCGLALRLPPRRALDAVPEGVTSQRIDVSVLQRSARGERPWGLWSLTAIALLAVAVTGALAMRGHTAWLGIASLDLLLVSFGAMALSSLRAVRSEYAALRPVARGIQGALRRVGSSRAQWRRRGDLACRGSVELRLAPRVGWRFARGVRSVSWRVETEAAPLAWRATPVCVVRFDRGSPAEKPLRALAARMGAVTALPDEARMEFRVALQGPEATEFQRAFRGLLGELVVRAPDDDADDVPANWLVGARRAAAEAT